MVRLLWRTLNQEHMQHWDSISDQYQLRYIHGSRILTLKPT